MQGGAAAPHVAHHAEGGRELGVEGRHDRPVEKVVLEVVVEHALLDRRDGAPMTVRVDQPGQEKLLA
jgi:hypothetical protein